MSTSAAPHDRARAEHRMNYPSIDFAGQYAEYATFNNYAQVLHEFSPPKPTASASTFASLSSTSLRTPLPLPPTPKRCTPKPMPRSARDQVAADAVKRPAHHPPAGGLRPRSLALSMKSRRPTSMPCNSRLSRARPTLAIRNWPAPMSPTGRSRCSRASSNTPRPASASPPNRRIARMGPGPSIVSSSHESAFVATL